MASEVDAVGIWEVDSTDAVGIPDETGKVEAGIAIEFEEELWLELLEWIEEELLAANALGGGVAEAVVFGELQLESEFDSGKFVSPAAAVAAASVARWCNSWAAAAAANMELDASFNEEFPGVAAPVTGNAADPGGFAEAGGLGNKLFGWLLSIANGFVLKPKGFAAAMAAAAFPAAGVTGNPSCPIRCNWAARLVYAACGPAAAICCKYSCNCCCSVA